MTLDFPHVETDRVRQGSLALHQALLGVRLARAELLRAIQAPPVLPSEAAQAWQHAVAARLRDLSQVEEIMEHARNVLAKVGRDLPRLAEQYRAAGREATSHQAADHIVAEAAGLLTLSAEQFLKMSEPIRFPPAPARPQAAVTGDGSVLPLDAEHALPDGMVLVTGREV